LYEIAKNLIVRRKELDEHFLIATILVGEGIVLLSIPLAASGGIH
jgi:hypothetical protein